MVVQKIVQNAHRLLGFVKNVLEILRFTSLNVKFVKKVLMFLVLIVMVFLIRVFLMIFIRLP